LVGALLGKGNGGVELGDGVLRLTAQVGGSRVIDQRARRAQSFSRQPFGLTTGRHECAC